MLLGVLSKVVSQQHDQAWQGRVKMIDDNGYGDSLIEGKSTLKNDIYHASTVRERGKDLTVAEFY